MELILQIALAIVLIPIAAYVLFWIALIGMASLTKTFEILNPAITSLENFLTRLEVKFVSFLRMIGLPKIMPWKFSPISSGPKDSAKVKK